MIVLVILNERPLGSHPDVHEAFRRLVDEGLVSEYHSYPHALRKSQGCSDTQIAREILELAADRHAAIIVWMHTGDLRVSEAVIARLAHLPDHPSMVYWEGDSYHPRFKPLPEPAQRIMQACDIVFLPCGGPIIRVLQRHGCRHVRYAPSCASETRFQRVWRSDRDFDHDVALIGNRVRSRVPFRTMPGARTRERLVKALAKRFGRRFAVYGNGWRGPSAMGPCDYDEQSGVNARSAVAVGVNNSTYPLVFSDRLPIALACGTPLAYSRNPGFGRVFGPQFADTFFVSVNEAVARIDHLLSLHGDELDALGRRSREFFVQELTTTRVCRHVISEGLRVRQQMHGGGEPYPNPSVTPSLPTPVRWQTLPSLLHDLD